MAVLVVLLLLSGVRALPLVWNIKRMLILVHLTLGRFHKSFCPHYFVVVVQFVPSQSNLSDSSNISNQTITLMSVNRIFLKEKNEPDIIEKNFKILLMPKQWSGSHLVWHSLSFFLSFYGQYMRLWCAADIVSLSVCVAATVLCSSGFIFMDEV